MEFTVKATTVKSEPDMLKSNSADHFKETDHKSEVITVFQFVTLFLISKIYFLLFVNAPTCPTCDITNYSIMCVFLLVLQIVVVYASIKVTNIFYIKYVVTK